MADYKFDGKYFKHRGTTIANVSGDRIRKGTGSSTVANIKDDTIREGTGSKVMANVKGMDIRQGNGSTRIGTMKDVMGKFKTKTVCESQRADHPK